MIRNKKIGIDLDGVVFKVHSYLFMHLLRELYLWTEKYLSFAIPYVGKMATFFAKRKLQNKELLPYAKEAIEKLYKKNEIYIVTFRSCYGNNDNQIQNMTRSSLKENGIKYNELIFSSKKEDIAVKKGLDMFFEDNLNNSVKLAENGVKVFLFDYPLNRKRVSEDNIERLSGWGEFLDKYF